jgi:WD40 repeat protein
MSGVGGAGRVIRLVEVETGSPKADLRGHREDISSLAFTPDGQSLLSASGDGPIRVWDVVPRAKEKSAHVFARNSFNSDPRRDGPGLRLSPDGRHLLAVYTDQTFSLWDTLRLAEGARHSRPFTNRTIAVVAPGGRLAAFGSRSGELMLWNVETGQARLFAGPGTNRIRLLAFSLDGRYLASSQNTKMLWEMGASNDTRVTVRVWDVGAQKEINVFFTDGEFQLSLTFSADAKALMAGFFSGSVKLWQLDRPGGGDAEFNHRSWPVEAGLALLPDGQTLISAGGTAIRFWDVRTRQETSQLNPRSGMFSSIALSGDGLRLAAGATDGRITIWDVDSHQELATLEGHKDEVMQLAFTPDGDHLVSASKDQLRVWRAASLAETDATIQKQAIK